MQESGGCDRDLRSPGRWGGRGRGEEGTRAEAGTGDVAACLDRGKRRPCDGRVEKSRSGRDVEPEDPYLCLADGTHESGGP